jgi:hypothetical protein
MLCRLVEWRAAMSVLMENRTCTSQARRLGLGHVDGQGGSAVARDWMLDYADAHAREVELAGVAPTVAPGVDADSVRDAWV